MIKEIKRIKYFNYQKDSIQKAVSLINEYNGCFILDQTGLGKTVTSIGTLINIEGFNQTDKVLVITTKANFSNWENMLKNANVCNYKVNTHSKIDESDYKYIIVDEAHNFRNKKSKGYENYIRVLYGGKQIPKVICLTATPYNNNMEEFFTLLTLIPFSTKTPIFYYYRNLEEEYKQAEKNISNITRYKGDDISFRDFSNMSKDKYKLNQLLDSIKKCLGDVSIRNTRESIVESGKDKTLSDFFPKVNILENIDYEFGKETDKNIGLVLNILDKMTFARQNVSNYIIEEKKGDEPPKNVKFDLSAIFITFLFKRLDSSIFAFKQSIENQIIEIESSLKHSSSKVMLTNSKEVNVTQQYFLDIKKDLSYYKEIVNLLNNVTDDEKLDKLTNFIKTNIKPNKAKSIIFTEYKDTFNLIVGRLRSEGIRVLSFNSDTDDSVLETIQSEFDYNLDEKLKTNKYDILVCTDVLAEGVNLHRAEYLVNFDLKWNPARLTQRSGRIDRITKDQNTKTVNIISFNTPYVVEKQIKLTDKISTKNDISDRLLSNLSQFTNIIPTCEWFEDKNIIACKSSELSNNVHIAIKNSFGYFSTVWNKPLIELSSIENKEYFDSDDKYQTFHNREKELRPVVLSKFYNRNIETPKVFFTYDLNYYRSKFHNWFIATNNSTNKRDFHYRNEDILIQLFSPSVEYYIGLHLKSNSIKDYQNAITQVNRLYDILDNNIVHKPKCSVLLTYDLLSANSDYVTTEKENIDFIDSLFK
jgi:superfamily II DNA/RNA helicase